MAVASQGCRLAQCSRRRHESTTRCHVVQQHPETYLALAQEYDLDAQRVPAEVEREYRRYRPGGGLGTLRALMVPYTLLYSMIWGLLLGLWVVVAGAGARRSRVLLRGDRQGVRPKKRDWQENARKSRSKKQRTFRISPSDLTMPRLTQSSEQQLASSDPNRCIFVAAPENGGKSANFRLHRTWSLEFKAVMFSVPL